MPQGRLPQVEKCLCTKLWCTVFAMQCWRSYWHFPRLIVKWVSTSTVDSVIQGHCEYRPHSPWDCQDHVQLWTVIWLLWSHRSSAAWLQTSAHHSGPRHTHTLLLSATLCISPHPVVTTLLCLPCCTVSSPCSVYIFYLVVFSPDLTYFHRTWPSPNSGHPLSTL